MLLPLNKQNSTDEFAPLVLIFIATMNSAFAKKIRKSYPSDRAVVLHSFCRSVNYKTKTLKAIKDWAPPLKIPVFMTFSLQPLLFNERNVTSFNNVNEINNYIISSLTIHFNSYTNLHNLFIRKVGKIFSFSIESVINLH